MRIAFYKSSNGTWVDKLTSVVSFSDYSHCELVFSDGICASASRRDGGVRFKEIDLGTGHWDTYDLEFILSEDEEHIRYCINILCGEKYDYLGAIGSVFGLDWTITNKMFCSYLCAIVQGDCLPITPGALFRILVKRNLIKFLKIND